VASLDGFITIGYSSFHRTLLICGSNKSQYESKLHFLRK